MILMAATARSLFLLLRYESASEEFQSILRVISMKKLPGYLDNMIPNITLHDCSGAVIYGSKVHLEHCSLRTKAIGHFYPSFLFMDAGTRFLQRVY